VSELNRSAEVKTFGIIALLLAGCAVSPTPKTGAPISLGGPVAEERSVPSDYVPVSELDHPPENLPRMGDRFDDSLLPVLQKTGPQMVVAVLLVGEDGRVEDLIVRKADHAWFAQRLREEARLFRFKVCTRGGTAVKWFAELPFKFSNE
jgi:hypothetical protein